MAERARVGWRLGQTPWQSGLRAVLPLGGSHAGVFFQQGVRGPSQEVSKRHNARTHT
jgi:hypothetical protein